MIKHVRTTIVELLCDRCHFGAWYRDEGPARQAGWLLDRDHNNAYCPECARGMRW